MAGTFPCIAGRFFRPRPRKLIEQLRGLPGLSFNDVQLQLAEAYQHNCTHNHHIPNLQASDDEIAAMLAKMVTDVYRKKGMPEKLNSNMVLHYANTLWNGLTEGYGSSFAAGADFTTPDEVMLQKLQTSVWHFSAAKNFSQLRALSAALIDETGKLRTFEQFRNAAYTINDAHVNAWLKAEYNLAVAGGQMAANWVRIEENKEAMPFLKYITAGDERVRQSHADLDGVVRPVDDDFYNIYYPPNGWGCRCDVLQVGPGYRVTPVDKIVVPQNVPALFKTNLAKNGLAFPANHPYFIGNAPVVKETATALQQKVGKTQLQKYVDAVKANMENALNVKISDVELHSDLDEIEFEKYHKQIEALTKEYQPAQVFGYSKPALKFKSSASYLGRMQSMNDGTILTEINFGHRYDAAGRTMPRVQLDEKITSFKFRKFASKSKADADKTNLATVTHEFAHVLSVDRQMHRSTDPRLLPFWEELYKLKRKYAREVKALMKSTVPDDVFDKNTETLNEIYLGDYASTNANEFMAEAFTEYKLSSNPGKYAKLVGELIDKTFKRK